MQHPISRGGWTSRPEPHATQRYGEPSIENVLTRLATQGIRKVTLAPLYPQFADSTVTTVVEEARRVVRDKKLDLQFAILQPFYDQPEYLDALVASAKPHLQQDYDHLQSLDAIGHKRRAHHQQLFHTLLGQAFQARFSIRFDPLCPAQA
jgi:hypothetical protein